MSSNTFQLKIAYTLGDLGGIGLEIFEKFHKEYKDHPSLRITLIDDEFDYQKLVSKIQIGTASAESGKHAYTVLEYANKMLCKNEYDYLITGPVAKESLWLAGIQCSGQTELLAMLNNLSREEIEMFFVLDNLRIVLATRHVPISEVPKTLKERFRAVLDNSINSLNKIWQISQTRIAVAGLNPHAGENGILGNEEKEFMQSIIDQKNKSQSTKISGPFASDSLLAKAAQNYLSGLEPEYDLYIAAYHDQALPLIKGIGGLKAINITAGLPYLRLSVDHGTGFDIAGKGIASPGALIACTEYCLKLSGINHFETTLFNNKSLETT